MGLNEDLKLEISDLRVKKKKKGKTEALQTELEKYEVIQIRRDQIKNAPYNPRTITDKARKLLRDNIKKVGLVAPITWNRRTCNIVSGHQRLDVMDSLERSKNYLLKVAAVDIDDKTEKEQNVFMNNPEAQGDFDIEKLGEMFKGDVDVYAMGFDESDVYNIIGEHIPEKRFNDMTALSNQLQMAVRQFEAAKKTSNDRNELEYYLVVVFKNNESRTDFCNRHGFNDFRYLDGRELDEALSR